MLPRSRPSRAGTVFVSRTHPRTWMSRRSYQWLLALASQARFRSASRASTVGSVLVFAVRLQATLWQVDVDRESPQSSALKELLAAIASGL